jgi:hypothetical protein
MNLCRLSLQVTRQVKVYIRLGFKRPEPSMKIYHLSKFINAGLHVAVDVVIDVHSIYKLIHYY